MPSVGLVIDSAALAFSLEDVKPRHIGAVEMGAVCADPGLRRLARALQLGFGGEDVVVDAEELQVRADAVHRLWVWAGVRAVQRIVHERPVVHTVQLHIVPGGLDGGKGQ